MDFWQICKYNNVLDEIEKKLPRKCALFSDIFFPKTKSSQINIFYLPTSAAISLAWQALERAQIQAKSINFPDRKILSLKFRWSLKPKV